MSTSPIIFTGADFAAFTEDAEIVFESSATFTPAYDMVALVTCIGGGGGGPVAIGTPSVAHIAMAVGGGGGGFAQDFIYFTGGTNYTFVVGSGGAGAVPDAASGSWNGGDGGNTYVTGGDISGSLLAAGGKGGLAYIDSTTPLTYTLSPNSTRATGTALTAKTILREGGIAGSCITSSTPLGGAAQYNALATGGGAVNIFGWKSTEWASKIDSGDCPSPTQYNFSNGTGGAGTGGTSGDANPESATSLYAHLTGGGGSGGSSSGNGTGSSNEYTSGGAGRVYDSATLGYVFFYGDSGILRPVGSGGAASTIAATTGNPGGGAGAVSGDFDATGGLFSGGGALVNTANVVQCKNYGGKYGGGAGGTAICNDTRDATYTFLGASGGAGVIILRPIRMAR